MAGEETATEEVTDGLKADTAGVDASPPHTEAGQAQGSLGNNGDSDVAEATCGDRVAAGDDEGGEDTEMGADKAPVQGDDEEKNGGLLPPEGDAEEAGGGQAGGSGKSWI